jgi:hypothetical protein
LSVPQQIAYEARLLLNNILGVTVLFPHRDNDERKQNRVDHADY